jgi:hypothetical protein
MFWLVLVLAMLRFRPGWLIVSGGVVAAHFALVRIRSTGLHHFTSAFAAAHGACVAGRRATGKQHRTNSQRQEQNCFLKDRFHIRENIPTYSLNALSLNWQNRHLKCSVLLAFATILCSILAKKGKHTL